ncbi:MAG: preprotein translocase subunit SecE [Desulfobacteraceae bacterium]|nr:preprotein translocase subunit SecE [Desulfobacteraceae bacterium]
MAKDNKVSEKNLSAVEQKPKLSVDLIKRFAGEVQNEFNKIAWPDRKHTLASTGVVVVLVTILSLYLATVDLLLGKLIGAVLR